MMNFRIHQNRHRILIFICLVCTFYAVNAQDTKPIIKPKPATTTKPAVVKTPPKPITTQTENKYSTVTDIDGNIYKTVKIGNQIWMAENLKTTRYNDGTPIPNVTKNVEWSKLTTGAYCYYLNDYNYGKLYNWYTVNTGKLAPKGWHVPTVTEWKILTTYLGGKMKSTNYWISPNEGASNSSGFSGVPAGSRNDDGSFGGIGAYANGWSSTESMTFYAFTGMLDYNSSNAETIGFPKGYGLSVRCVRD